MKSFLPSSLVFVLASLLTACSNIAQAATPRPGITAITNEQQPTKTPSPFPTQTRSPTLTASPTPTIIGGYPGQFVLAQQTSNEWWISIDDAHGSLVKTIFKLTFNADDNYADYLFVNVSPSGDTICLNYEADGVSKLMLLRPDGTEVFTQDTNLGFYGGWVGQANWSPDGQWLVFTGRGENSYTDIYRVDKNGNNLEQLTDNYAENSAPLFLPKGNKIQYLEGLAVKVMNLEDKSTVQVGSKYPRSWTKDERYFITGGNTKDVKLVDMETHKTDTIYKIQHPGAYVYTQEMMFSPNDQWVLISEYDGDHIRKSPIPYGNAWYKVNLSDTKELELIAFADQVKFTPDKSMMILHGYLPSDNMSVDPKYYAIDLQNMKATILKEELAWALLNGFWLLNSKATDLIDTPAFPVSTPIPTGTLMP